jgi:tricarballylate dehydrogenase
MAAHGVRWQQPLAGTLHLGRTNRWFLGGGKALLNTYYRTASNMGISIRYDAPVRDLVIENGSFKAVVLKNNEREELVRGRAVVIAAGGFEANLGWLKQFWGEAADNFIVRGSPYNDGSVLANLFAKGAKPIGDPKELHAIAVDARAPKYDGGIVTRLDSIPFGIVVNRLARRFYDEGEDIWPKRYASWGKLIAEQPGQIAYCIVDAKTIGCFLPPMYRPYFPSRISIGKLVFPAEARL